MSIDESRRRFLERSMNATLSLLKPSGERFEGLRARVTSGKIKTYDTSNPIEEEDVVEVDAGLPDGRTERFVVLQSRLHPGNPSIPLPPSYEFTVEKESTHRKRQEAQPSQVYNLTGHNARVNVHSHDQSVNVMRAETGDLFQDLRSQIAVAFRDSPQLGAVLENVAGMEAEQGKPGFLDRYRKFVDLAKDHAEIISRFIPLLTPLIGPPPGG